VGQPRSKDFYLRKLQDFLLSYEAKSLTFNRLKLAQAKLANPSLFKEKYSQKENEELWVEWYWPDNEVTVAGPRQLVEAKLLEFEQNVNNAKKSR